MLKPPPVQLVALVELQVRVEGTVAVGFAVKVQVGAGVTAVTVTAVHTPQLLVSLLSVMVPTNEALLSVQART